MADMTLPNSPEMHRMSKQYYDGPKAAKDLLNTTSEGKQTATPMIDRAMRQEKIAARQGFDLDSCSQEMPGSLGIDINLKGLISYDHAPLEPQPESLLKTIEIALKDIYEWACEKQRDNQGLLYDLNTAISAVERCGVKIKDGQ